MIEPEQLFFPGEPLVSELSPFFVGREEELHKAMSFLEAPGRTLWVTGEDGVGKTSFAWQLMVYCSGILLLKKDNRPPNSYFRKKRAACIWFDCLNAPSNAHHELGELITDLTMAPQPANLTGNIRATKAVQFCFVPPDLRSVTSKDLIIFIDNLDHYQDPESMIKLKKYFGCHFVFTSSKENFNQNIKQPRFSRRTTKELIIPNLSQFDTDYYLNENITRNIKCTMEYKKAIWQTSNGHPPLFQSLGQASVQHALQSSRNSPLVLSKENLAQAIQAHISSISPLIKRTVSKALRNDVKRELLTRAIHGALRVSNNAITGIIHDTVLSSLVNDHILTTNKIKNMYTFGDPIIRLLVIAQTNPDYHLLNKENEDDLLTEVFPKQPKKLSLLKTKILNLQLKNIRCFENVTIPLNGSPTLFMGINGRGKSTLLQFPALALTGLERPLDPNIWAKVVKTPHEKAELILDLLVDGKEQQLTFVLDQEDHLKPKAGKKILEKIAANGFILAYGAGRNITRDDVPANPKYEKLASLFGNNGYLKNIRDSEVYTTIQEHGDWIVTQLNTILALADENFSIKIRAFDARGFYFKTATDPQGLTPLEGMSDGFRATFVWLFDLLVRAAQRGITHLDEINGVVLIDEIDLHLHPTWQRTLMPVLEQLFKNVQFLVTTHSPFVAQSWQNENVFLLEAEDTEVKVSKMEGEGRPFGHEIESVIASTLALESQIPSVSHRLFQMLVAFDQAVEQKDAEAVMDWYRKIQAVIPSDSGYHQYLDIMSTGFREEPE